MTDDTYRWLTAVWTPLLSVLLTTVVTAVATGIVAILATRAEAGRAEKRAQAEALKDERKRAVVASWEWYMAGIDRVATALQPPTYPITHQPLEADSALIGDAAAASSAVMLWHDLSARPLQSGLTLTDLNALVDVEISLTNAARRQLDLVAQGQEPVRMVAAEMQPEAQTALREVLRAPRR